MLGVEPGTSCVLSKSLSTELHSQSFWFLNLPAMHANSDKLTHVCRSRGQRWRSVEVRCLYYSLSFLDSIAPVSPLLARLAGPDHLPLPHSTLLPRAGITSSCCPTGFVHTHRGSKHRSSSLHGKCFTTELAPGLTALSVLSSYSVLN